MAFRRFVALRLIRLLPVIALGAIVGGALLLTDDPPYHVVLVTALNASGLPAPDRRMFPTNDAEWSLFCEIGADMLLAAAFSFIDPRALVAIVAVRGCALVPLTITHGHIYHDVGPASY